MILFKKWFWQWVSNLNLINCNKKYVVRIISPLKRLSMHAIKWLYQLMTFSFGEDWSFYSKILLQLNKSWKRSWISGLQACPLLHMYSLIPRYWLLFKHFHINTEVDSLQKTNIISNTNCVVTLFSNQSSTSKW